MRKEKKKKKKKKTTLGRFPLGEEDRGEGRGRLAEDELCGDSTMVFWSNFVIASENQEIYQNKNVVSVSANTGWRKKNENRVI